MSNILDFFRNLIAVTRHSLLLRFSLSLEEAKGLWCARRYGKFLLVDLLLKFLGNPYRICARFLRKRGDEEIYVYGETPLRSFMALAEKVPLQGQRFVDLGCGRGRLVFFAALALDCEALGIDQVPGLIKRAKFFPCRKARFFCGPIQERNLKDADVVYLAGTCMEAEIYEECLQTMKPGALLLSVSEPVTKGFILKETVELPFHFGSSSVYILERTLLPSPNELVNNA